MARLPANGLRLTPVGSGVGAPVVTLAGTCSFVLRSIISERLPPTSQPLGSAGVAVMPPGDQKHHASSVTPFAGTMMPEPGAAVPYSMPILYTQNCGNEQPVGGGRPLGPPTSVTSGGLTRSG